MSNLANLSALEDPPLGIKDPILPPPTLGQTSFLQPKFLVPKTHLLATDETNDLVPEISERMPSKVVSATPIQLQIKTQTPQNTRLQRQAVSSSSDSNYVSDYDPTIQSVAKQISTELNITETVSASAQKSIPKIQAQFLASQQNNVTNPVAPTQTLDAETFAKLGAVPETPSIQQVTDQTQTENLTDSAIAPSATSIPQIQRQSLESQRTNQTEQVSETANIQQTPDPAQTENLTESAIAQPKTTILEIQRQFLESQEPNVIEVSNIQQIQEQSEAGYLSHKRENDAITPNSSQPRKMPEIQRKFLESQQKSITSIANVQNKNIPTLPSVLQNISHIQSSLSDKKNRIVVSQSIVTPTEDSWDSIDDLLGANTSNTHSPSVQRSPESNTASSWSSIGELLLSSGSSRKKYSKSDSDTDNLNIMRKPEVYFTSQGYQSITPRIQRLANNQEVSSKSIPDVSVSSIPDQQQEQLEGSAKDLEMLAQEIYCLLKQRIQIERERQGGSYFGQLPW